MAGRPSTTTATAAAESRLDLACLPDNDGDGIIRYTPRRSLPNLPPGHFFSSPALQV